MSLARPTVTKLSYRDSQFLTSPMSIVPVTDSGLVGSVVGDTSSIA